MMRLVVTNGTAEDLQGGRTSHRAPPHRAPPKRAPAHPSAGRSADRSVGSADLEALPKAELQKRAQKLAIPGRSKLDKGQLIAAIRRAR